MRELVGLCSTLAVRGVVAREAVDYQHTSVRPWVVSAVPALSPVDGGATLAAPGGVAAARVREGGGGGFGVDGVRSGVFCGNGRLGELEGMGAVIMRTWRVCCRRRGGTTFAVCERALTQVLDGD